VGGSAVDHFVSGHLEGCSNVAEGRPATQSSVAYGGEASRAVDGNGLDGNWGSASCTHTDTHGPSWWQVDLGQVQDIRAVQIANRADCCQEVSPASVLHCHCPAHAALMLLLAAPGRGSGYRQPSQRLHG
jgi:hypothetical protein